MSDISDRINARLDGHDHREWCRLNSGLADGACDCTPGATREQLADAIRAILEFCDDDHDAPAEVRFLTETIRQVTGMSLGIVNGNEAITAVAKRFRPSLSSQPMDGRAEQ